MRLVGIAMWTAVHASCSLNHHVFEGITADDAGPDARAFDANLDPDAPGQDASFALGTMPNPARDCVELRDAAMPSAEYWVYGVDRSAPPFQVYCEQQLFAGGWAMLENSVRRQDGSTLPFWQFDYADRLGRRGTAAPDDNYYDGSLYTIGTEYLDIIVDLQGQTALAARMTATAIDPATMHFINPMFVEGNQLVYGRQFAAGWSSRDHDDDPWVSDSDGDNCATFYADVAQHYGDCWYYSLGSDAADLPFEDGGVGPHVDNRVLVDALHLAPQPDGGQYSQVTRIARFTRW